MKLSIFVSLLLFCFSHSVLAASRHELHNSPSHTIGYKAYQFNVDYNQWTSRGVYDDNGQETTFGTEFGFSKREADFDLTYGHGQSFDINLGVRWRQNISETDTRDNTNSGVESYVGGFKYKFKPTNKRWLFAAEVLYRQTTYSNSEYDPGEAPNTEIVLGDSGQEIEVMGHLTYENTTNHFLYGKVGYRQTANNLSPEVFYKIESNYPYEKWFFAFGLEGIYSLNLDEYGDNVDNKPAQDTGPTNLFNSINRSYLSPYLQIGKGFKGYRVAVKGRQVTDGFWTDEGYEFGIELKMRVRGKSRDQLKIEKFKEYLVEASVIKISPRGKFVKFDKGLAHDIEKGMKFDVFKADYFGGNILVASGEVIELGADWSIIRLIRRYRKLPIQVGFTGRGY